MDATGPLQPTALLDQRVDGDRRVEARDEHVRELASFGRGILTAGDILWSHPTR